MQSPVAVTKWVKSSDTFHMGHQSARLFWRLDNRILEGFLFSSVHAVWRARCYLKCVTYAVKGGLLKTPVGCHFGNLPNWIWYLQVIELVSKLNLSMNVPHHETSTWLLKPALKVKRLPVWRLQSTSYSREKQEASRSVWNQEPDHSSQLLTCFLLGPGSLVSTLAWLRQTVIGASGEWNVKGKIFSPSLQQSLNNY